MAVLNALEFWAGNDVELDVSVTEDDGETPLDLSAKTLRWVLTSVYDKRQIFISKDSGSGPGIDISSGGVLTITLAATDSRGLGGEPYYHELWVDDVSGASVTVATGAATIHKTALG